MDSIPGVGPPGDQRNTFNLMPVFRPQMASEGRLPWPPGESAGSWMVQLKYTGVSATMSATPEVEGEADL